MVQGTVKYQRRCCPACRTKQENGKNTFNLVHFYLLQASFARPTGQQQKIGNKEVSARTDILQIKIRAHFWFDGYCLHAFCCVVPFPCIFLPSLAQTDTHALTLSFSSSCFFLRHCKFLAHSVINTHTRTLSTCLIYNWYQFFCAFIFRSFF